MNSIPLNRLNNENVEGFQIKRFAYGQFIGGQFDLHNQIHRDSHFLFLVIVAGHSKVLVDFNEVTLVAPSICYILPSQVHLRINNLAADYWVISVDTSLVPKSCRDVFDRQRSLQTSLACPQAQHKRFCDLLLLLDNVYTKDKSSSFYYSALNGLLVTFLTMVADCFRNMGEHRTSSSRSAELYGQFKQLLSSNLYSLKSASAYAAKLNVSETYLNEVTKKITDFPVSYWIRQEIILEAKRLLYYTDMDVKQIAYELGYDNYSYFSRIFRKTVGMPASVFRKHYRK